MAPKQPEAVKNPPLASASEEDEDEESGSSGEESESSGEDSKKEQSSDDEGDDLSKPIQKTTPSLAPEKLESDSEGESDSDSDPKPTKEKQPKITVVTSGSAVTLPESSTAKRPLNQADDETKKKVKTSTTEHVKKPVRDEEVRKISGEEAKKMFQRLFSEADEIALLQGIVDYGGDISEDMDAFCEYVSKLIVFNANRNQIVTKIQRLKKKFLNTVKKFLKKGKGETQIRFSKDAEQKAFDLSRKIWGTEGIMASKSRKKLGGTPKEIKLAPKEIKLAHSSKKQEEMEIPKATVVNSHLSSSSREIAWFFKSENASVFGVDESTVSVAWDMVADGPKKIEMEERWKKLKATKVELCLQRTTLVDNAARMIFKDNASSSS